MTPSWLFAVFISLSEIEVFGNINIETGISTGSSGLLPDPRKQESIFIFRQGCIILIFAYFLHISPFFPMIRFDSKVMREVSCVEAT